MSERTEQAGTTARIVKCDYIYMTVLSPLTGTSFANYKIYKWDNLIVEQVTIISAIWRQCLNTMRVIPKVMSNHFLHANWKQQKKKSMVVDGTSCCVILEHLVTSIACITWPVSLLTKWLTTICRFASVLSSNFSLKRKSLLQKFTRDFSVLMEVCAWVRAVFKDGWNILKMGKRASKISLGAVALEQPQMNATRREWMRSFKMTGVWLWTQ